MTIHWKILKMFTFFRLWIIFDIMNIYKVTNLINGKIYIGREKYPSKDYLGSGKLIGYAIKKYGKENFQKNIIEIVSSKEDLNKREIFWIWMYDSADKKRGYNIMVGGTGGDTYTNNPSLELIKQKLTKRTDRTGKTHTEVSKNKIRQSCSGIKRHKRIQIHFLKKRNGNRYFKPDTELHRYLLSIISD